ncbi:hypothetical protein NDU88_002600 [Pleurodeles waltl]|uniref:Uncharacterized protein n=1 Tax=Pleurodeles waltl TaxID=8319 RepID=A0AAV7UY32_PLEWA|nr:hypothetical protein NDU88_002600 [Pleurodeles waltl]
MLTFSLEQAVSALEKDVAPDVIRHAPFLRLSSGDRVVLGAAKTNWDSVCGCDERVLRTKYGAPEGCTTPQAATNDLYLWRVSYRK